MTTPELEARILSALPWGREAAITYPELAERTGIPLRGCQAAVEVLRANGASVCSGSRGIWLTADPDELLDNYRRLRARAIRQLANLRRMRRTADSLRRQPTLWERVA